MVQRAVNPSPATVQHMRVVPRGLNVLVPHQLVHWPGRRFSSSCPLHESRGPAPFSAPWLSPRYRLVLALPVFSPKPSNSGSPGSVRRKWATKSRRAMMGKPSAWQSPPGPRWFPVCRRAQTKEQLPFPYQQRERGMTQFLRPDSILLSQGSGEQSGKYPRWGSRRGLPLSRVDRGSVRPTVDC